MRWLVRFVGLTAARRIIYILVGVALYAALSTFGIGVGQAHAQSGCFDRPEIAGTDAWQCGNRQTAYSNATTRNQTAAAARCASFGFQLLTATVTWSTQSGGYAGYAGRVTCRRTDQTIYDSPTSIETRYLVANECPSGQQWNDSTHECAIPCSSRPPETSWYHDKDPNTVDAVCSNGCTYELELLIPEGTYQYSPTGNTCVVNDNEPVLDTDQDGTPDTQDAFPNDSSENADSDGDGIGDNGDAAPNDPSNGQDGSTPPPPTPDPGSCGGAGQPPCERPGDESDNVASGGGTCDAAPTCSGDGIQCNMLYQQWRTRCAVEGQGGTAGGTATGTGGTDCSTPPIVTGDPVGGIVANQAWATRCAVEAGNAAAVTGDIGNCSQPFTVEGTNANAVKLRGLRAEICNGDSNGDGQPDWTQDEKDGDDGSGAHAGESIWGEDETQGVDLDDSGLGFGTSCPAPPEVLGHTLDWAGLCNLMTMVGLLVLAMAHMHAIYIIVGD